MYTRRVASRTYVSGKQGFESLGAVLGPRRCLSVTIGKRRRFLAVGPKRRIMEAERENMKKKPINYEVLFAPDEAYEKYMEENGFRTMWRAGDQSGHTSVEGEFETVPDRKATYKRHFWFNAERVDKNTIKFAATITRIKV